MAKKMTQLTIFSDGGARGNPGPAGAGAVILDADGKVLAELHEYLGETTNNQAEYRAMIMALKAAKKMSPASVAVFADSELVVKQINGEYRVKDEGLKPLFKELMSLLGDFSDYKVTHVRREKNKHADKLANKAIDSKGE